MKIVVIGSRDSVLGFSLAGIHERYLVTTREEAEEAFTRCLQDCAIGIILIEQTMADHLATRIRDTGKKRNMYPIIIPIPGSGDV
jgi:vacuolar-type H+-ATPase subunit F/Vma7